MLLISKPFEIPLNNININLQRDATKRTLFVRLTRAKRRLFRFWWGGGSYLYFKFSLNI